MKKITFFWAFIALLSPLLVSGQTEKKLVYDSIWVTNIDGVFFQNRLQKFSNLEQYTTSTLIGDTTTTQAQTIDKVKTTVRTWSQDANIVNSYRIQLSELIRSTNAASVAIGINVLDSIRNEYYLDLFTESWSIGTVTQPEEYIGIAWIENNDSLFYITDTTAVARTAEFIGSVIRLYDFNGYTTDFFLSSEGHYQTVGGQHVILPQGSLPPVARAMRRPPKDSEQDIELLTNGTVRIGEKIYKYSTKTKKWKELK